MKHDFEDEFAHLVWGEDVGLGGISTVAVPPNAGAPEQQANSWKRGPSTSASSTRQGVLQRYGLQVSDRFVYC